MPISSNYKDLFHIPLTKDKLNLFQLLLDTNTLTVDLALALLKMIHKELSIHQNRDRSVYKHYAEVIAYLDHHIPEMLNQVVNAWDNRGITAPMEWFSKESPND